MVAQSVPAACPRCQGTNLSRKVSRFARVRNADSALDDLADSADTLDENDPRAVRRFLKDMASEMDDDDITADDLEALVDPANQEPAAQETVEEAQ
jgi:hypothetical protein